MADAIEVFMPALSSTMTEGKIVEWTAKVGDKIKSGDTIMVVESDKVRHIPPAYLCIYISSVSNDKRDNENQARRLPSFV